MNVTVSWVRKHMEELAPLELTLEGDNVGLLVGDGAATVSTVLVALDLTEAVLAEAIEIGASMVVTHHPLFRKPLYNVNTDSPTGRKVLSLIKNNIALYSAHTNLDCTNGGTSDVLFEMLGLVNKETLMEGRNRMFNLGRVGELMTEMRLSDFIAIIKKRLNLTNVSFVGDANKIVKKIGLCTGSCSSIDFLTMAKAKGCDLYICGDVTYHNAQAAYEMGLAIIDGTHFATEYIISSKICDYLFAAAYREHADVKIVQSSVEKSPLNWG